MIWQPCNSLLIIERPGRRTKKGGGNGRRKSVEDQLRRVWIRCHPSIFEDIFEALQKATTRVLDAHREVDVEQKCVWEVVLTDLRRHFNIFDLIGPKSSQVIKGALTPIKDELRKEFHHVSICYFTCRNSP